MTCLVKDANEQSAEYEVFHDQSNYDNCIDNLEIEDTVSPLVNQFKHADSNANAKVQIRHPNHRDELSPNSVSSDHIPED